MSDESGNIIVKAVLLSEDISESQSNGRSSLINVYSGIHVIRGPFPVLFQVGVSLVYSSIKHGQVPIEIMLKGDALDRSAVIRAILETYDDIPTYLTTTALGVVWLNVVRQGDLNISVRQHDEDFKLERVYHFKHKPIPAEPGGTVTGYSSLSSAIPTTSR